MTGVEHQLDLDDGVRLRVDVHGAGPPIVVLHGFTGDASTMAGLTTRLAETRTVIVPDLIGHGGSSGAVIDHYGVDAMARQVLDVVEMLGHAEPIDLVGYSMGGRVAFTIACRFPAHVASLSLIGASAGIADAAERAEREAADAGLAASLEGDGLEAFVDRWMANPLFATQARLGDDFLAAARMQRLGNSAAELARSLRAAGTGTMRPLHDLLAACAMPVSLVVGADDAKFTAIADDLAEALPDACISSIDHAGHAAHLEQPDAAVAAIEATTGRAAVRSHLLSIPLRRPHATGRGTTTRRDSVLFALRTEGCTGWGEASPLPGWSDDDLAAARRSLPDTVDFGTARSAWEATADVRDRLVDQPSARAALAGAALDLDARRHGLPLWRHLAESQTHATTPVGELSVNALVSATSPGDVESQVAEWADAGFATVKLKVGALGPEADIERVAAARAAAPDVVLRVDANGAWDTETAIAMLRRFAKLGVVLCEEPVRGIAEIAAVGRAVDIAVAVDESLRLPADLDSVLAHADALDALVVKPQALGGSDRAIALIEAALGAGLDVIVTSMIDSAVGLAHAAHVAAACGLRSAHGLATASLLDVDVATGLPVADGRLVLPTTPGLGIGLVSPVVVAGS